ncbi:MAG: CoA-binding protein [Bacteroidota bacterium]
MSKIVVIGASLNPSRYSHQAVSLLSEKGYDVIAIGRKDGQIGDVQIHQDQIDLDEVDTISLYLSPQIQAQYHDYIKMLGARRIIFNPGTENPEFQQELVDEGVDAFEACTLVMLRTGQF